MSTLESDEIVEKLKTVDFGYDVSVSESYNASDKVFPRIVVTKIARSTGITTVKDVYTRSLGFQVDVFAQDTVDKEGNVVGRVTVARDIVNAVSDFMFDEYKMNEDDQLEDTDYSLDTIRKIARYSCVIDRYGYTYRR